MNIAKLIREIDNREVQLLFDDTVELSNGNIVDFDAYREVGGTTSYIHIENSIYALDYYECEFGISVGAECVYGEEKSIHLDAIYRKLDL